MNAEKQHNHGSQAVAEFEAMYGSILVDTLK
jgi:hypothetical protein